MAETSKSKTEVGKKKGKILKSNGAKLDPKVKGANPRNLPAHHFKLVKVKRGISGLGLFALEDIKKGEMIIEYVGNVLNDEQVLNVKSNQYLFEVGRNRTIDGSVRSNIARYCNHSCDGNAESEIKKGRVFILATKNIKEGDEIVYDYGEEFVKEFIAPKGCRCSAKKHKYGAKGVEMESGTKDQSIDLGSVQGLEM